MNLSHLTPPWTWKSALWRSPLWALAFVYEALLLLRLFLYQRKILPTHRPAAPVIAVGNLTVGGTGKTPVIELLARTLQAEQRKVVILSRGYGRRSLATFQRFQAATAPFPLSPKCLGDEPFWLAQRNPEIPIYVGGSRTKTARWAQARDQPDVLLLDDAFQHVAVARDLNLLLIDAERGLGNRQVLPLGELREPEHHWKRADAILLTKANLGFAEGWTHRLRKELDVNIPIFRCDYSPARLRRLDGQATMECAALRSKSVFASCGIAQPDGFARVVEPLCGAWKELSAWPDHQAYTAEDVQRLLWLFRKSRAQIWLTTEKDAVKLAAFSELQEQVWAVEMEVRPEPAWQEFLIDFLRKYPVQ